MYQDIRLHKRDFKCCCKSPEMMKKYKTFLAEKEAKIQAEKIRKKGRNRGFGI